MNRQIDRRRFLSQMGVATAVSGFASSSAALHGRQGAGRPNFIIILSDDQGYEDLGCFGSRTIRTPRLDAMAEQGLRLTSFYSQPVCGPARTALMTGCYPMRVGRPWDGWSLPGEETTVAEVLKGAGYDTCCIGKWDLSLRQEVEDRLPNSQGFDYYLGTLGANDRGRCMLWRNREKLYETSDMGSLTGLYTEEAIRHLREKRSAPFFLYLAHTMPHVQLGASERFRGRSKAGLYGDVIEELDDSVGRLMDTLKEQGLDKNTIVLYFSDNGPWLIKGDQGGSSRPLRDGKGSSWEGGFRVPAIFWGPGKIPAGRTSNSMMASLDILPTFAALANTRPPSNRKIDGLDQSRFITGQSPTSSRETFYYYVGSTLHAVRKGKWKLAIPSGRMGRAYIMDQTPLVAPELYDLETDISESKNLANEKPDVVADLLNLVEEARRDIGDKAAPGEGARNLPDQPGEESRK
ncbi:MAG: sulfatase [Acidobacteriota bacterium]